METLKKSLLVGFVLACIVLIVLVWAQGLNDSGSAGTATPQATLTAPTSTATHTDTPAASPASTATPGAEVTLSVTPGPQSGAKATTAPTPNLTQTWEEDQFNG